eukprot:TRINITY_DN40935_c0_g1_i1.p1 TRINITY_DN40935_c0_g1~~TRINITY_DN40935_c0_g1_i1.p1  ORF type:complete len:224 (-),score=45.00 TRINITY_DN40935_c0_g1_i1:131-802(-)
MPYCKEEGWEIQPSRPAIDSKLLRDRLAVIITRAQSKLKLPRGTQAGAWNADVENEVKRALKLPEKRQRCKNDDDRDEQVIQQPRLVLPPIAEAAMAIDDAPTEETVVTEGGHQDADAGGESDGDKPDSSSGDSSSSGSDSDTKSASDGMPAPATPRIDLKKFSKADLTTQIDLVETELAETSEAYKVLEEENTRLVLEKFSLKGEVARLQSRLAQCTQPAAN